MSYLKDFQKKIALNDCQAFLTLWEEYCYSDQPDAEELKQILQECKNSELAKPFGRYIERAILLWNLLPESPVKGDILALIFDMQTTQSENLYDIGLDYLKNKYPNDKFFEEKLRLIGLRGRESFQGAIRGYELLSHLDVGKFVFHNAGWGTGEIIDFSMIREEVTIEFEFLLGAKTLSFTNALKTLIPLPDDHFLSKRFGNPDALEKEAKEHPLKVMHILLKDLGPKTAAEIKDELCELVILENEWSKWWQTTRSKIKKDTKISSPSSLKEPFKLLKEDVSHEETLYKALETKPNIDQTIQLVYSFLRDFPSAIKNKEVQQNLITKLHDVLSSELPSAEKLQILFILQDLKEQHPEIIDIIKTTPSIPDLIEEIDILSFKKRILIVAREHRNDWQEIFFSLFFSLPQNLLRDYLLNELKEIKPSTILEKKIQNLLNNPLTYPQLFVWYFQKILESKSTLPFAHKEGMIKFLEGFFILLDHLEHKPEHKDLTKKMINLLIKNKYKVIRDIFSQSSETEAKEFILLSTKCRLLSNHDIKIIQSLAEVVHPSIAKKIHDKETEDTLTVWTTAKGYEKIKKKIEYLATVETIQNAKEIEEARSHGDLRENAEYKAALEKRDRLQSELKFLSEQFNRAKILQQDDVTTAKVGVGTRVHCTDTKGKKTRFLVLGPWEADPEKNILSFQSKLAKEMTGLKVGETFTFQNEKYTVDNITNYFEEKI